jgi:periplasmic divalent cation tolerance protein
MSQPDTPIVVVLTTVPTDFDVDRFAQHLLERRLAACVSVLPPMRSVYRWQGAVEHAEERQVVMKTRADRVGALEQALAAVHPYEVPEFLVLPVALGSPAYTTWVVEECGVTRSADL